MKEDIQCEGCSSTNLEFVKNEQYFLVYRCLQCNRTKRIPRPLSTEGTNKTNRLLSDIISELIVDRKHSSSGLELQRLSDEFRTLELQFSIWKSQLNLGETSTLSENEKRKNIEIYLELIDVKEKTHNNLMRQIVFVGDPEERIEICKLAQKHYRFEKKFIERLSSLNPSYIRPRDFSNRLAQIQQKRYGFEVEWIQSKYPILKITITKQMSLDLLQQIIEELQKSRKNMLIEYSGYSAHQSVKAEFDRKIQLVNDEILSLRKNQLSRLLITRLSARLPDNLGELGREMDKIDTDIQLLKKYNEPAAKDIIQKLRARRRNIVERIQALQIQHQVDSYLQKIRAWLHNLFPQK